jgi:hypothetical protein
MNGETAQALALVANGNAVLAGDRAARSALSLEREPFRVISLTFVRAGVPVATRPLGWIDHLRGRGVRRLALVHLATRTAWLPEHEPVAGAGGNGVMIAADVRPWPELWAAAWRVDVAAVERRADRVWNVVYHAAAPPVPPRADEPAAARWELEHAHDALRGALEAVVRLEGESTWTTGFFAPALALLAAREVLVPARGLDLLPARGYGAAARRLLAGATLASSVFGGMGSWNAAHAGEDDGAWAAVGDRLVEATDRAVRAAVNAFGVDA